jgi:predicted AAA+ superfamily ATPase
LPKDKSFFLFGPRQTGKTWLLNAMFARETTAYYDLLKSEQYLRLLEHPDLFRAEVQALPKEITHVVIDEVQRVPQLLNEVQYLMGTMPSPPNFILTGSSARKLKRGQANLLAGRALTYHLFPLTANELGERFVLTRALSLGTLPSVYLEKTDESAKDILRAYVETYLKEEIELEAQVRGMDKFVRFLSVAGQENGNVLNFSNIARETGSTYHTVQSYFQILEDTLVGKFIFPYLKSARKRVAKRPKFYFFDSGIVRAMTKRLAAPILPHTSEFGFAFEHFLILEIFKEANNRNRDYGYYYYRTESGAEVDLIIEKSPEEIVAVEIKGKDVINSSDLRGLRSFSKVCPAAKLYCVCLTPRKYELDGIMVLPWQEFLQQL